MEGSVMTEEQHALVVPLLKQLGPDLGGQAGRSPRTPGRRWGRRLRQAVAGPIEIPPEAVPIVEPFLADLGVAYAFDLPYGYELLGPHHCTESSWVASLVVIWKRAWCLTTTS
jgi:hypothetical protein